MSIREGIVIAGWAGILIGLFLALPLGLAFIASGALTLAIGLFAMPGSRPKGAK